MRGLGRLGDNANIDPCRAHKTLCTAFRGMHGGGNQREAVRKPAISKRVDQEKETGNTRMQDALWWR